MRIAYKGITYELFGPCPFCGSAKLAILWGYASHVVCNQCAARGPKGVDPKEAVDKWNEAME